jgi:hypothetical protein
MSNHPKPVAVEQLLARSNALALDSGALSCSINLLPGRVSQFNERGYLNQCGAKRSRRLP